MTKLVTVRMKTEMYDKIKELAEKDRRNLSNMICILLEDQLKSFIPAGGKQNA